MYQRIFLVWTVVFGTMAVFMPQSSAAQGEQQKRDKQAVSPSVVAARALSGAERELPTLRLVAKPADSTVARSALSAPAAPGGAKEIPFIETTAEPVPTEAERQRGYILFQRPTTEVIYPNTRPLPHERIDSLGVFATPGQFEPVTLALYPLRPLKNLNVRISPLACSAGAIPADCVDVRLATYWNIGFPAYTTVTTYRRVPELLERVTVHCSPALECQRYWLIVHVPDGAKPGIYRGTVTVWDDGFEQALEIPLALRVLDFKLQKDPAKHFSAYFYTRDQSTYKGRNEAFIRRATDNDYRAMAELGLDMLPTLHLDCKNGKISLRQTEELQRMLAAGLKGPAPISADDAIVGIYQESVPKGKWHEHWRINPLPPPAFYARVTELFRAFEQERKANGWPEFIYCPIDEVDVNFKEFGVKVYAALKAAGARTYATKDPCEPDAADYAPHLDIWCSQPYSVPFERIISQNRFEYWCYPNQNACEVRDPQTMCKGGRMTYGFGFWHSGYTTLIPWHWSWNGPNPRDYLRGKYSGCGQRMDDDGEVIPAIYWTCFRQGNDDERYLYTLQQAVVERQGSQDPACQAAVHKGRQILQETWEDIRVQPKYLAEGMWPSEEFDAIRWQLAAQTSRLLKFPAVEKKTAPSVLLTTAVTAASTHETAVPVETAERAGNVETFDLLADPTRWENETDEGKLMVPEAVRGEGKPKLHWTVLVDHQHDGGEGGQYPIGWPRILRSFKPGQLDMTRFDTLQFRLRIDSDRNEVARELTPIGITISAHGKKKSIYETRVEVAGRQQTWVPLQFFVKQMMEKAGLGEEAWKSISRVQFYISESDFAHGTRLVFDIGEVSLLRLTSPILEAVHVPSHVLLPRKLLAFDFHVAGVRDVTMGSHTLTAAIEDAGGAVMIHAEQDLANSHGMALPLAAIGPGKYRLRVGIQDAKGKSCSEWTQSLTAHAGPFWLSDRFERSP